MERETMERKPEHPIDKMFTDRWSSRAMSGEPVKEDELMPLFEAAKWAPSSYNDQPWRFVYALRNTQHWDRMFNLLVDFNQAWAKNAGALAVVASRKGFERNEKPNPNHSFDTGAAWENFALQGSLKGLVVHGMAGFDQEKARKELKIPENFSVEAMIAIGKPGKKEDLPEEMQKKEILTGRKKLMETVFEGEFPGTQE